MESTGSATSAVKKISGLRFGKCLKLKRCGHGLRVGHGVACCNNVTLVPMALTTTMAPGLIF